MSAVRRLVAATGAVGTGLLGIYLWERTHPQPLPYSRRMFLVTQAMLLSPKRLLGLLEPKPGERILELGPGTGTYTFIVAEALAPGGALDVVDVQQEMLDHVVREAERRGIATVRAIRADAASLPFEDGAFDAAYAVSVLGEVADQEAAWAELARVVKPRGRLVLAENAVDPHWIRLSTLVESARRVGFELERKTGTPVNYYASFHAGSPPGA